MFRRITAPRTDLQCTRLVEDVLFTELAEGHVAALECVTYDRPKRATPSSIVALPDSLSSSVTGTPKRGPGLEDVEEGFLLACLELRDVALRHVRPRARSRWLMSFASEASESRRLNFLGN